MQDRQRKDSLHSHQLMSFVYIPYVAQPIKERGESTEEKLIRLILSSIQILDLTYTFQMNYMKSYICR